MTNEPRDHRFIGDLLKISETMLVSKKSKLDALMRLPALLEDGLKVNIRPALL
ncbi:hypothetical protein [Rhizobium sp. BR 249]|uniref:hypothetical protein n=1 Tax=Rhizobium sp. BR 249 TaxID=3040011 RepID=UPI0039BF0E1E